MGTANCIGYFLSIMVFLEWGGETDDMTGPEYGTCFGKVYQRSLGLVAASYVAAWRVECSGVVGVWGE